ncbi:hypothetical protein AMAG_17319 [Allomyces macrogynus ATCC 38327]|uniref:separase n=1 Tax=Allomyces macrogynus (strain ATCC 38327) TaxID=578462 RepID=A0A0L0TEE6_ALLM3|nr:hypothetical protein AMAG_17319 [Allomyces macrogynus ATCC 38327]|eukprot:KNE73050.1 hypothetical protein AMAG_17319 [Allomyces macrogynus ATCC 38327]
MADPVAPIAAAVADPAKLTAKLLASTKSALQSVSQHANDPSTLYASLARLLRSCADSLQAVQAKERQNPSLGLQWTRRRDYLVQTVRLTLPALSAVEALLRAAGIAQESLAPNALIEKRLANIMTFVVDAGATHDALDLIAAVKARLESRLVETARVGRGTPSPTSPSASSSLFAVVPPTPFTLTPRAADLVLVVVTHLQHYLRVLIKAGDRTLAQSAVTHHLDTATTGSLDWWLAHLSGAGLDDRACRSQYVTSARLVMTVLDLSGAVQTSPLYPRAVHWLVRGRWAVADLTAALIKWGPPATATVAVLKDVATHPDLDIDRLARLAVAWCTTLTSGPNSPAGADGTIASALHWLAPRAPPPDLLLAMHLLHARARISRIGTADFATVTSALEDLLSCLRIPRAAPPTSSRSAASRYVSAASAFTARVNARDDALNPFNDSVAYAKALIHDTVALLVAALSPAVSADQGVAGSLFEWLLYLAQLAAAQDGTDKAVGYLGKAAQLADLVPAAQGASQPPLVRVSHALQHLAATLHSRGQFRSALAPAQMSVAVLERHLAAHDDPELRIKLARKLELVAAIDRVVSDADAADAMATSTSSPPRSRDRGALRAALRAVVQTGDRHEVARFVGRQLRREALARGGEYSPMASEVPDHWVFFFEWKYLFSARQVEVADRVLGMWVKWAARGGGVVATAHALLCRIMAVGAAAKGEESEGARMRAWCEEAIALLSSPNLPPSEPAQFVPDLLATVHVYRAFLTTSHSPDATASARAHADLAAAFQLYKRAVSSNTLISSDDTQFHLAHIERVLLGRASTTLLPVLYQVQLLIEATDRGKAAVLIRLAELYLDLGYITDVGSALATAREYLAPLPAADRHYWTAVYAEYLVAAANPAKAAPLLDSLDAFGVVPGQGMAPTVARNRARVRWLRAQGRGIDALVKALETVPLAKQSPNAAVQVADAVVGLFAVAGLWRDAEVYASQAMEAAERRGNTAAKTRFATWLAYLAERKGELDEAAGLLSGDGEVAVGEDAAVEGAMRLVQLGHVAVRRARGGAGTDAVVAADRYYVAAADVVSRLKARRTVTDLFADAAYTPRVHRMLHTGNGKADHLRAAHVGALDADLARLHADVLVLQNRRPDAEKRTMAALNAAHSLAPDTRAPFFHHVAKLHLDLVAGALRRVPAVAALDDAVVVLDATDVVPTVDAPLVTDTRITARLDLAEQVLWAAVRECGEVAAPAVLLDAAHMLMAIHAVKRVARIESQIDVGELLEETCHGVTFRRMRALLGGTAAAAQVGSGNMGPATPTPADRAGRPRVGPQTPATIGRTPRSRRSTLTPRRTPVRAAEPLEASLVTLALPEDDDLAAMNDDGTTPVPPEWAVVRLSVDTTRNVLIVVTARAEHHATVRLPLMRASIRAGSPAAKAPTYARVRATLDNVVAASEAMLKETYVTRDDKVRWWDTRTRQDRDLFAVLTEIDAAWLGGFRGLLHAARHPGAGNFLTDLARFVDSAVPPVTAGRRRQLQVPIIVAHAWLALGTTATSADLDDMTYFVLDEASRAGYAVATTDDDAGGLEFVSVRAFLQSAVTQAASVTVDMPEHVFLVLDKHLIPIPWEATVALRGVPVSRLFGMDMLDAALARRADPVVVDGTSVYYVVNPAGDLPGTQAVFEPMLRSRPNWHGQIGVPPDSESHFLTALQAHDLFLYFGHGGGESLCPPKHLLSLPKSVKAAFLMGCSSGKLPAAGDFEPMGTAINYLLHSPCVVANLWDVTDKDIDRFALAALTSWGLFPPPSDDGESRKGDVDVERTRDRGPSATPIVPTSTAAGRFRAPMTVRRAGPLPVAVPTAETTPSLAAAVARAREHCHFPYLIGAAPVVYGAPVHLVRRNAAAPVPRAGLTAAAPRTAMPVAAPFAAPTARLAPRTRAAKLSSGSDASDTATTPSTPVPAVRRNARRRAAPGASARGE